MNPRCTHVAIRAHDIERSVYFYTTYVGLKEVHRRTEHGVTVVWLGESGRETEFVIVLLGLPHAPPVQPPAVAHIGYSVPSREVVDALASRAHDDGILKEPAQYAGPVVGYFCIVEDPDGNWIEFSYGQSLGA